MVIALVLSAISTDPLYSASFAGSSALTSGLILRSLMGL
jgi:hypothetical protein